MNEQQMYQPQEQSSRQWNIDPREQTGEQQSWQGAGPGSDQGYYGYASGYNQTNWIDGEGQKLRAGGSNTLSPWQWVVGAILVMIAASIIWSLINFILGSFVFVLGLAVAVIAASQFSVRTVVVPTRIFRMDGQPALIIRNARGSLHIHRGMSDTVEVRATKYVNGWFASNEEGAVDCEQEGNTLRISSRSNFRWSPLGGLRNVNLDITVPARCTIQTDGEAGTIRIEGVSGQVRATTNAGTIHVEQSVLEGGSSLTTNAGTIHAQQMALKGQVDFHTNAGTVYFAGSIDPRGEYRFGTNMGTVDAVLPANSSFTLAASTDLGTVNNQFGSTTVGVAPHARLALHTNLGTVSVRQGAV